MNYSNPFFRVKIIYVKVEITKFPTVIIYTFMTEFTCSLLWSVQNHKVKSEFWDQDLGNFWNIRVLKEQWLIHEVERCSGVRIQKSKESTWNHSYLYTSFWFPRLWNIK